MGDIARQSLRLSPLLQEALRGSPALRKYPLTAMEALEGAPLTDLEGVYQEVVAEYGERFPGGHVLEDYARLHGGSLADPLLWRALEEHEGILEAMGWRGSLATLPEGAFPDGSHAGAKESPPRFSAAWRRFPLGETTSPWRVRPTR